MCDSWVYTDKRIGWVNTEKVEIYNIEEGLYGDVAYFEYENEEYSSHVVTGSRPGSQKELR